ncbi:MAG: hypothetical protein IPM29_25380 [Planctomycetes bacterium]|nr:hypothetical protein [Planctomycetota bacterium]
MSEPGAERVLHWPGDLGWLDRAEPPALRDRVALIAFWTAGDVQSLELLQTLAFLALRFAGRPLCVVAVHSARPPDAADEQRVAAAARRLGARVPVAVDRGGIAFRVLGGARWPSLALVDTGGRVRYRGAGLPDRERLTAALDVLLRDARGEPEELWTARPALSAEDPARLVAPTGLAFDALRELLWIADGPAHRLCGVEPDTGVVRHLIGCGRAGSADGDASLAAFAHPAGLCCHRGRLHVADLGNHLVRTLDVDAFGVFTACGIGRSSSDVVGGQPGLVQGLCAPTAISGHGDDELVVATAGSHQLWTLSLRDGRAHAWCGTGRAGGADGIRYDATCQQPTGVAVQDDRCAFVDALSGAVRLAELGSEMVYTVIPPGGAGGLRTPVAVAWLGRDLLVADAAAATVSRVDIGGRTIARVAGPEHGLVEPRAVAVAPDAARAWVADSGAGAVFELALGGGLRVRRLELADPHSSAAARPPAPPQTLAAQAAVTLCFPLPIPAGERLHDAARPHAWVRSAAPGGPLAPFAAPLRIDGTWGSLCGVPTAAEGRGEVVLTARYATCADPAAVVHVQEVAARFEVEFVPQGGGVLEVQVE